MLPVSGLHAYWKKTASKLRHNTDSQVRKTKTLLIMNFSLCVHMWPYFWEMKQLELEALETTSVHFSLLLSASRWLSVLNLALSFSVATAQTLKPEAHCLLQDPWPLSPSVHQYSRLGPSECLHSYLDWALGHSVHCILAFIFSLLFSSLPFPSFFFPIVSYSLFFNPF